MGHALAGPGCWTIHCGDEFDPCRYASDCRTAFAGELAVGAYVQITGTAGAGLRLRERPALDAPMLLLGAEAEVFVVEQGPQEADGYVWWYLVGPYDADRRGWAVANYLQVVQKP
jgi:hypothetical protein